MLVVSTNFDAEKRTLPENKVRCVWDSAYSDGKQQTIPGYNNKIRCVWNSAYSDKGG